MKRALAGIICALAGCSATPERSDPPEPLVVRTPGAEAIRKRPTLAIRTRRPVKIRAVDLKTLLQTYERRDAPTARAEVQRTIARYGSNYGYDLVLPAGAPAAASLPTTDITWNVLRLLNSPPNLRGQARQARTQQVDPTGQAVSARRIRGLRSVAGPLGVVLRAAWEGADLVLDCELDGV